MARKTWREISASHRDDPARAARVEAGAHAMLAESRSLSHEQHATMMTDAVGRGASRVMHDFRVQIAPTSNADGAEWLVFVQNRRIRDVRFVAPSLRVRVSDADRDGVWVASDGVTTVHGDGETPDAAVDDYLACLADQFLWESENEATLGLGLQAEFAELSRLMTREPEQ